MLKMPAASHPSSLRDYLASTTLPRMDLGHAAPPMPPEGHKTHRNTLSTRPLPQRVLGTMQMIEPSTFCSLTTDFMDRNIPRRPISAIGTDPISRDRITIPAEILPIEPYDMTGFNLWLLMYPLRTVEAIIHFIYPETKEYRTALRGFSDPENGIIFPDDKIFRYIKWAIHNPRQLAPHVDDTPSLLNVTVQPPWILSPQDLQSFVNCRKFPYFDVKGDNKPFDGKERLWAKIWDLSVQTNSPWFVLSTYWGWVFGVFSKGRSRAWISSVIKYSDDDPTVLECLVYWICSSMGLPGGFEIPEVPEYVQCVAIPLSIPTPNNASRVSSVDPSQSWSGDSEEMECDSYDGSRSDDTPVQTAFRTRPCPLHPRSEYVDKVHRWFEDQVDVAVPDMPPSDWRELSPAGSDLSDSSTSSISTVKDYRDDEVWEGGWLTGNPEEARPVYMTINH